MSSFEKEVDKYERAVRGKRVETLDLLEGMGRLSVRSSYQKCAE